MKKKLKTHLFLGLILSCLTSDVSFAITAEIRRISDNSLAGTVDFGSIPSGTIYAQGAHYLVVSYAPGEPDTDSLQLFTDNINWSGGSDPSGLVATSYRVPVFWSAYSDPQVNIGLDAQNESTWRSIKDKNDPGFAAYSPNDVSIPLFQTGTTYIYFGAKASTISPSLTYFGAFKVSNTSQSSAGSVIENGIGQFDGVFRWDQEQQIQIPYSLKNSSEANLVIYDRKGKIIKTLASGFHLAGNYTATWNARNDQNEIVSSGVYFISYEADGTKDKSKVVLIR